MTSPDGSSRTAPASPPVPFALSGVDVDLDGAPVLRSVDLTIRSGEYVVLLGENGSGKTTLLRAMLGLVPAARGQVLIHGAPVARFSDWRRVAYVPQRLMSAAAVPVSVEEAVAAALVSPRTRWRRASGVDEAVTTALQSVGLLHRRKERLDTLSGGQQRRVLVARALATGADTLALDEPTAGVDADSELRMVDVLSDLHDAGATIVLVTHDLGEITAAADHVVVLGGRSERSITYDGPPPPPARTHDHVWHHDGPVRADDPLGWSTEP